MRQFLDWIFGSEVSGKPKPKPKQGRPTAPPAVTDPLRSENEAHASPGGDATATATAHDAVVDDPVVDNSVVDNSVVDNPVVDNPVVDNPVDRIAAAALEAVIDDEVEGDLLEGMARNEEDETTELPSVYEAVVVEVVVCPYCEEDVPYKTLPFCPSCSRNLTRARVQNQESFLIYLMDRGYLARHWVTAGRTIVGNEDVAMRRYFIEIDGKRFGSLHVERHEVRLEWHPEQAAPDLTPNHWQALVDAFESYPDTSQSPDRFGLARLDMMR
jgi:hypothetical protein